MGTAAAYLVLATSLVTVGLLVMHVLAPVRHWDDSISRSVVGQRSPFWNAVSYWGTFIANTMGVGVVAAWQAGEHRLSWPFQPRLASERATCAAVRQLWRVTSSQS